MKGTCKEKRKIIRVQKDFYIEKQREIEKRKKKKEKKKKEKKRKKKDMNKQRKEKNMEENLLGFE